MSRLSLLERNVITSGMEHPPLVTTFRSLLTKLVVENYLHHRSDFKVTCNLYMKRKSLSFLRPKILKFYTIKILVRLAHSRL